MIFHFFFFFHREGRTKAVGKIIKILPHAPATENKQKHKVGKGRGHHTGPKPPDNASLGGASGGHSGGGGGGGRGVGRRGRHKGRGPGGGGPGGGVPGGTQTQKPTLVGAS